MTPTDKDIEQQFRNAPRLDPTGQPRSNSGIPDQEGDQGSGPGRASPVGGPPVAEHIGGFNDRPVTPPDSPRETIQNPSRRVVP